MLTQPENKKEMALPEGLPLPVFKPNYDEQEVQAVRECLQKGWTGCGPKVKEFEEEFARYVGSKYAVATNSCTASLHLAVMTLNIPGAEIISTPMTFVSTNHAILYNQAVPVFADIQKDTMNIDPADIRAKITPKTRAVIAVHFGGHACDLDEIQALTQKHGLALIEDCAHACGGLYQGRKLGSFGDFGCFSFHAVKNMATGDGGMIVTNDKKHYDRLMKLRWVGISKDTWNRNEKGAYSWDYNIEELGFKYQMNDITAAIGLVQLRKLDGMNQKRRALAKRYREGLAGISGIELPGEKPGVESARHNFIIKTNDRDGLMEFLKTRQISTGVHYRPNNHYELYQNAGKTPAAEEVWKRIVTLPLYPSMTTEQQDYVIRSIKVFFKS